MKCTPCACTKYGNRLEHNCSATWRETVPVHEVFRGQTVWQREVEVFDLQDYPKAKRAYAWSHRDGQNDEGE